MPLVINSLGGGHTHTHANAHTDVHTETISVVFPVGVTIIETKSTNNFKLMRIAATQMIAHYSVNFNLIKKSFKSYLYSH